MNIGISTNCFFNRRETEEAAADIAQLNAKCADVYFKTFYEYRPEFSKALAPRLSGFEVNSVRVNPCNFEAQLFSPSRRVRGDGFYWLDQIMRSAQLLGCKRYAFYGVNEGANIDGIEWYLREAVLFCASYGVQLCLTNSVNGIYNRPNVFSELKKRIPELAATFDMGEALRSGYPYGMYIEDMACAISHAYLSVDDLSDEYLIEEVLKRLKGAGFDGNVIIDTSAINDADGLARAVEKLKIITDKI